MNGSFLGCSEQLYLRDFAYNFVGKVYICTMENDFRKFISERPSLCISKMAKELKIDRVTISKILDGLRKIPKARHGDFYRFMIKYGNGREG